MYKSAYLLKHRCCDSVDQLKIKQLKNFRELINYLKCRLNVGHLEFFKDAHYIPIFQSILMILISKFMVHRALSDKTCLSLGLLSPLKKGLAKK